MADFSKRFFEADCVKNKDTFCFYRISLKNRAKKNFFCFLKRRFLNTVYKFGKIKRFSSFFVHHNTNSGTLGIAKQAKIMETTNIILHKIVLNCNKCREMQKIFFYAS